MRIAIRPLLLLAALAGGGCAVSRPDARRTTVAGWSGPVAGRSGPSTDEAAEPDRPRDASSAVCFVEAPRIPDGGATRRVLKRPARTVGSPDAPQATVQDFRVRLRTADGSRHDAPSAVVAAPAPRSQPVIPAEWVEVPVEPTPGLVWIPVVCENSVDRTLALSVQRALLRLGYDPGSEDGLYGPRTRTAVERFKRDRLLYGDGLTHETLEALSIALPRPAAVASPVTRR